MSSIHPECSDSAAPDQSVAVDVLLRQEPEEEEDEEEREEASRDCYGTKVNCPAASVVGQRRGLPTSAQYSKPMPAAA